MSWQYTVDYLPESTNGTHELTMTAIGTERIEDSFGVERDLYLRVEDIYVHQTELDIIGLIVIISCAENVLRNLRLLCRRQYWLNFTTVNGAETSLFGNSAYAHFNRTNIIGVPGHPNGYDDTYNVIQVTENVTVNTPSGSYLSTYYKITDLEDNVDSWNYGIMRLLGTGLKLLTDCRAPTRKQLLIIYQIQACLQNHNLLHNQALLIFRMYALNGANLAGRSLTRCWKTELKFIRKWIELQLSIKKTEFINTKSRQYCHQDLVFSDFVSLRLNISYNLLH